MHRAPAVASCCRRRCLLPCGARDVGSRSNPGGGCCMLRTTLLAFGVLAAGSGCRVGARPAIRAGVLPYTPDAHSRPRAGPLRVAPAITKIYNVLPGRYAGTLWLFNLSSRCITNVGVTQSCFCVSLPRGNSVVTLPARSAVMIPFAIELPNPGDLTEAVTFDGGGAEVNAIIDTRVLRPFPDVGPDGIRLPRMLRHDAGCPTNAATSTLGVAQGVAGATVSCSVPWITLRAEQIGRRLTISASAAALAPEGPFSAAAEARYECARGRAAFDFAISGTICSRIRVDPPSLSFGVINAKGSTHEARCDVYLDRSAVAPVWAHCNDPRVQVTRLRQAGATVDVGATVHSRRPGEVCTSVVLQDARGRLAAIPVFAYAAR